MKSVQIVDADGNGRGDLLLVNWEDRNPFRLRLQNKAGELGPELYFPFSPIRSYWADNLEQNHRTQIISIAQNSGRAQVAEFAQKPAEVMSGSFRQGQFQVMALGRTDKARRGVLWADISGDGRPDLLVAEPESGQISISEQQVDGTLAAPKSFPTLAGISELAVADWDEDGQPEIFMLSSDERQVGFVRFDAKRRLPFPTFIPIEGRPLVLAVGKLSPDAPPILAVITDVDGKRSLITRSVAGTNHTQRLSDQFKSSPAALTFHDADQDGLPDLVVLVPYEKVKVLRQVPGCDFTEIDIAPPGGAVEQPWFSAADIDGDGKAELLLTQKNFVRAVAMKPEPATGADGANRAHWGFIVKEQINGMASNSRLTGAAVLSNAVPETPSLFLLDAERKVLSLCERDVSGVWRVVRNTPLPISEFNGLQAIALGGTNLNAVAFLGLNQVAVSPSHR